MTLRYGLQMNHVVSKYTAFRLCKVSIVVMRYVYIE